MIIRVFRAKVRPGSEGAYERLVSERAVPLMERCDGLLNLQIGRPHSDTPGEFVMVSTWLNQESLEKFAGPGWREPLMEDDERALLAGAAVSHYEIIDGPPA